MKVCIAEKPSVAKEIAKVIGATQRCDGFYQGNGYQVTWTFGHFCTLYEPSDYKPHWKSWNYNTLPMLPKEFEIKLIQNEGVNKQFKIIASLLKDASLVINCGDAGQEGELIQRWVLQKANYTKDHKRLWISSLTSEAIKEGFTKLQEHHVFDNLFEAGKSRAIGDWILGMNATRLYTLRYGNGKQVLSVGRVQTPTLAMLVRRHFEIDNFIPLPYWELHTTYKGGKFTALTGKIKTKDKAQKLLEISLEGSVG